MFKFYIKSVGGEFSIYHRLTHTFMESVETEKELVKKIKEWNEKSEEELWSFLINKRCARIPQKNHGGEDNFSKENEKMYREAWSAYTELFYKKNKRLVHICEEIPYAVVNDVKRGLEVAETKRMEQERKDAEDRLKRLDDEEREEREEKKVVEKVLSHIPKEKRKKLKVKRVKGRNFIIPPSL